MAFWKHFLRRPHEPSRTSFGIGEYGGFVLLATPRGFFVLNPEWFADLRIHALSAQEQSEYRKLLILSAQSNRRQQLDTKICLSVPDWLDLNGGDDSRFRMIFSDSDLAEGIKIALGAIDWGWSQKYKPYMQYNGGPTEGWMLSVENSTNKVFLPKSDMISVVTWPTKSVFRYARMSIHIDLYEPEWAAFDGGVV